MHGLRRLSLSAWITCALLALPGCDRGNPPLPATVRAEPNVRTFTDEEVASMAIAINDAAISASNAVDGALTTTRIADYSRQLVLEHSAANARMTQLDPSLVPFDNGVSQALRQLNDELLLQLSTQESPLLDATYLFSQAEVHAQTLTLIDCVMVPSITDSVLASVIDQLRIDEQSHLATLRQLRVDLVLPNATGGDTVVACADLCAPSSEAAAFPQTLRAEVCR